VPAAATAAAAAAAAAAGLDKCYGWSMIWLFEGGQLQPLIVVEGPGAALLGYAGQPCQQYPVPAADSLCKQQYIIKIPTYHTDTLISL
jgi:hypothetical protein